MFIPLEITGIIYFMKNTNNSKKPLTGFNFVNPNTDFPKMEREFLGKWQKNGLVKKYLQRNNSSKEKFSFLDGPITANNPMGVHHAWGRTYKDFWQRFWNMRGKKQRFQNGFDEQGLWVEVEVEKELGLKNKKDIENLVTGDKFKSLEMFINLCKDRVKKFSAVQTEQSKRLGYFMDWDNSYHTSSDENNYSIWNFLKVVNEKGWLYKGHDSVPWCPRCGTAISQHEILTEEYKELEHESVFFKLPIIGKNNEYLLVWTTTPWTIPSNVAVAVNKKEKYSSYVLNGENLWLMDKRIKELENQKILIGGKSNNEKKLGKLLIGWEYNGPFDDVSLVKKTLGNYIHNVIDGEGVVTEEEGTGLLHVAPGAGEEDFKLGKENKLPVISSIEEDASYVQGMGKFSGQNAKWHPELIIDYLEQKNRGQFLLNTQLYKHRYPTCWRCKTELVWRVVDEWYIAMDKSSNSKFPKLDKRSGAGKTQNSKVQEKTFREQMAEVAKKINWLPDWGLERELDWLKNMHDWLISKKRYWGLALPIWECKKCKNFEVIGSKAELKERAVSGWNKFEGNSPHRPWIDEVKIKCSKCGNMVNRIPDVGNPWLDAGIVPFSTMPEEWFPAEFITESFPGQFKNWFYSLIAMSTALKKTNSFKTVLGFASVRDEQGEEMHKSKGNAIEFNEAADKIGVDVMRWLYLKQDPEQNLNLGYHVTDDVRRYFHLRLWNVYSFFVTYANINKFQISSIRQAQDKNFKFQISDNVLDKWIISRLNKTIKVSTELIEEYSADKAVGEIENFVINDLSNWFVRRSRDRVSFSNENIKDKDTCLSILYFVLMELSKLLAPFIPFISEEIYTNVSKKDSVHLENWPEFNDKLIDKKLEEEMQSARQIVESAHALRKSSEVKVRIPIKEMFYNGPFEISEEILNIVKDEINAYSLTFDKKSDVYGVFAKTSDDNLDLQFGLARDIVRKIQQERKKLETKANEKVMVYLPYWPKEHEEYIKKKAMINKIIEDNDFKVVKNA
ncbi:MAG: isoleucine--tRNA ligase [Candidatus Levybacteria bacterium CG10_big_fil_rev_8_21_14_0_10_35_13]|nr:MAG: isoleucine--tRNA ligase [Candidatus Levybacteria bacterium CG10_big_fil_rev_8_21_14_0_10_35_13]